MENPSLEVNVNRRKMLFKILRVATSKLITGEYRFPNVAEISAEALQERLNSDRPPLVIDTRSEKEFSAGFGHIPDSKLIPMMDMALSFGNLAEFRAKVKALEVELGEILPHKDREVVTICPGGGFSLVAAEIMAEAGFTDVKSLDGGIDGWFKQGYPTVID